MISSLRIRLVPVIGPAHSTPRRAGQLSVPYSARTIPSRAPWVRARSGSDRKAEEGVSRRRPARAGRAGASALRRPRRAAAPQRQQSGAVAELTPARKPSPGAAPVASGSSPVTAQGRGHGRREIADRNRNARNPGDAIGVAAGRASGTRRARGVTSSQRKGMSGSGGREDRQAMRVPSGAGAHRRSAPR